MKHRLHRRLMAALAAFTFGVSALFGLFAMVFVYTVEDRFFERLLAEEAQRQQSHVERHGQWAQPASDFITVHAESATLPAEITRTLAAEPNRREMAGEQGRHYHLQRLQSAAGPAWLVAEVSQQLIVRPMRDKLLRWLALWGTAVVGVSLALAWALSRRVSAPLETLAARASQATPEHLPQRLADGTRDDEVGALARSFDALLDRTRAFIAREQAFTRDASHELRTPVAVLRMGLERLQGDPAVAPSLQAQLASMHAATLLMQQTIDTLLLLAREPEGSAGFQAPPTAVLPLLEQWVVAHAQWLDHQRLTLDVQLARHDALALPAPVLQLAMAGLLSNAFAHGQPGGQVVVSFEHGALSIRNPSPPLPQAAGETFVKGSESDGLGVGLSIVRRLLARHGGQLALQHQQGWTVARLKA